MIWRIIDVCEELIYNLCVFYGHVTVDKSTYLYGLGGLTNDKQWINTIIKF